MAQSWITAFAGTEWKGKSELWLDPEGNQVITGDCTIALESASLSYTWTYEGDRKTGSIVFHDDGATWTDSWHQPESVRCENLANAWGLFTLECSYSAPPGPDWGWRIKLSQRPDDSLVLQMTNIAPWGEEGRAVRMVLQKIIL